MSARAVTAPTPLNVSFPGEAQSLHKATDRPERSPRQHVPQRPCHQPRAEPGQGSIRLPRDEWPDLQVCQHLGAHLR